MNFILTLFTLLAPLAWSQTNEEILDKLVREETHGKVVNVFKLPESETSISATYAFPEMRLRPQDVLYFLVPERLSHGPVSQIGLGHRQKGPGTVPSERDPSPGLTSALIYSTDFPGDEFRYWAGHASGKLGAKFAEYRTHPEEDSLYEWPRIGHKGLHSKDRNKDPVHARVVRIQNVGTDDVYFSKLYLEIVSPNADEYLTYVFTPKSDFGDPLTLQGRFYGGGQIARGKFPNALRLEHGPHAPGPKFPAFFTLNDKDLFIDLPPGSVLSSIDIMCGDTFPDEVKNKDGGLGSLGNGRLTISVQNKVTQEKRILLKDKNVGPQGVISASDISPDKTIAEGDRLAISNNSRSSTVYIMAIRIGINHAK